MNSEATRTSLPTLSRAFVFHGYGATPTDHWFGWLANEFEAAAIHTRVPVLPHPLEPDAKLWEETVGTTVGVPDEHTVIVAHSLGCLAVLRYLASLQGPWHLGMLVLVSGFVGRLPVLPELDQFIQDGCDVSGIAEHIDRIIIIRSDDDPLVPPAITDRLAGLLGVSARVIAGAGHFLADDGVTALPHARDAVLAHMGTSR